VPAFASVSELENHLHRDLAPEEVAPAEQLLELATGLIQSYTGQELWPGTTTEVVPAPANFSVLGGKLVLRQRPVTAVTSVTVDDTDAEFVADLKAGIVHVIRTTTLVQTLPDWPRLVTVTYQHGYDPIPAELKAVCLDVAKQVIVNPHGYTQVTVGEFSAGFGSHADAAIGLTLTTRHERMLAGLRR
jgi:hypothetical protein